VEKPDGNHQGGKEKAQQPRRSEGRGELAKEKTPPPKQAERGEKLGESPEGK